MASPRKTPWKTFQRFAEDLVYLTASEAPKLIRQLQHAPSVQQGVQRGIQQGIKIGLDVLARGGSEPPAIPAGRPVTSLSVPTAHRARTLVYAPNLAGRADPGEVVWTWVVYEHDPSRGEDRAVLVVGRDRHTLLGLLVSGQASHHHDPDWVSVGTGPWDDGGGPGWVRLDRVLDVPEEGIRREGAIMDRPAFEVVATRLRAEYSWG
jgi:hypothetical protein